MAYLTLAQLRALPNLSDTSKFTDAELTAATTWFEVKFERYTGVAWELRTATDERHYGAGSAAGFLLDNLYPRTISALRTYETAAVWTAYTAAELEDLQVDDSGRLGHVTFAGVYSSFGLVAVDYTYGKTVTPPADILEEAKVAIRDRLLGDNTGNRVYAVQSEAGIVRQSTPGPKTPFGIPSVDEVANAYRERVGGIA